jgi:hypothetical protein
MRATPGDNSGLRGWDCCVQLGEIALYDREGAYLAGAEVCHTVASSFQKPRRRIRSLSAE